MWSAGIALAYVVKRIVILVAALFVIAPASASASFHLMKITEVFPGTVGNPDSAFVELQMFQPGQNAVIGRSLRTYSAARLDDRFAGIFQAEFLAIGSTLFQRIEREETGLYPLYKASYP